MVFVFNKHNFQAKAICTIQNSHLLPLIEVGEEHVPIAVHKVGRADSHLRGWSDENNRLVIGMFLPQPYCYGDVVAVCWGDPSREYRLL